MIDEFCIFERGGTVLWRRSFVALKGDPLATLVRSVLLEDRLSLPEFSFDCYTLRWVLDNEKGVVFVVIFQRLLPPAYADDLLHMVRKKFTRSFVHAQPPDPSTRSAPFVVDCSANFDAFTPVFEALLDAAERKSMNFSNPVPRKKIQTNTPRELPTPEHPPDVEDTEPSEGTLSQEDVVKRNREDFIRRQKGSRKKKTISEAPVFERPKGKVMRPSKKATEDDLSALDFSGGPPTSDAVDNELLKFKKQFMDAPSNVAYDTIEMSDEDDEQADNLAATRTSGMFNYFKGLAGMRNITREDLTSVMEKFREGLIGKNVAQDIADRLIESVVSSLEGKKMESMTSVSTMVRNALEEALTRILTARQSTDIITEIAAKKGSGKPYVIAYCGVNGVGKSTSLAKTCYYLLNHGYKVMIAACDTFRAGAVEQLRTHVKCLGKGVELFDRGYGKDAAAVAMDATRKAKELGYDVVLVDTAGRMQDNEPLMRALAKLVEVNQPDRLFFVGEALVGNDAVDQLTKFNAALTDHQKGARPRLIDGIVLTKFDTIDDKVGAAVSMVYTTGQPIVFVGVGQTYMDLRKINTKSLVKALLK